MTEILYPGIGPGDAVTEGITIRPKDLEIVRVILRAALPAEAGVCVFGSRAKGTKKRAADLDLAIDAGRKADYGGRNRAQ